MDHEEFHVPDEVRSFFSEKEEEGAATHKAWQDVFASYESAHPELAAELNRAFDREWNVADLQKLPKYTVGEDKLATRKASGDVIQALSEEVNGFFGGSADLASSNNTLMNAHEDFTKENRSGRNVWFGVREFATAAAVNGIMLHGGLHAYGATFLVFSDYMRPAIRLSALMNVPATYVFTHDSIAVGEDGPTHEPVEQTGSLRMIPNLAVIRPADANETTAAWKLALEAKDHPTALILTRQGLPTMIDADAAYEQVKKGAYVLSDSGSPDVTLLATGSEVSLALDSKKALHEKGIEARVVSMPSQEWFEKQSTSYKEEVLPLDVPVVSIEAGTTFGWERYTGRTGASIGIDTFGASAPGDLVMEKFGFNVDNVVSTVTNVLK